MIAREREITGAPMEIGEDGVPLIGVRQPRRRPQFVQQRETRLRTGSFGHGDGAIQRVLR